MKRSNLKDLFTIICLSAVYLTCFSQADVTIIDSRHYSNVFGETRNYRVFLPPGYSSSAAKRYPVIYFYHGWSQRFFGSGPDGYNHFEKGDDNGGDNIAAFVSKNDVIVVKPDGYNRSESEEYYLRPYNIGPVETLRQFPLYFPELVREIDAKYRTIPDRNHRAVSGLSMGGFMSFWIGGKYPDMICAIGNFCGSDEFVIGPKDFPVEYRHIDMFKNYDGVNVRLNYGDEDFIRYYHRDLNKTWLQVMDNYQYAVYKAGHSTCGMGDMFSYLAESFKNPPQKPERWNHTDVYPSFSLWDYEITTDRDLPGFTVLENVDRNGFRCSVREYLPSGEYLPSVNISVLTAPLYKKNAEYNINDVDLRDNKIKSYKIKSDLSGRLNIDLNGNLHEIGINEAAGKPELAIAGWSLSGAEYAVHNTDINLNIRLLNKGASDAGNVKVTITPFRKNVKILKGSADFGSMKMNQIAESKSSFVFRTISDTTIVERLMLKLSDGSGNSWTSYIEVPVYPKQLPEIKDFEIADGRKVIVSARGVGKDTLVLGSGNGDGIVNPGESVVILVKDRNELHRAEILVTDPKLNVHGESIRYSDNWGSYDHVGGSAKYSEAVVSSEVSSGSKLSNVVEYWLGNAPEHIIKQGLVSFTVSGTDKTAPVADWLKVSGDNTVIARITDGAALAKVTVTFTNKKEPSKNFTVQLNDSGKEGDRHEADRYFSFSIPVRGFGFYNAVLQAEDSNGNVSRKVFDKDLVIH
jgi:poly(3-hydroxybutyrate) depolymerase